MKAYLVPHVPFMIQELGGQQLQPYMEEIIAAFDSIQTGFEEEPPDAILICSPHFNGGGTFKIGRAEEYRGSYANFKRPDLVDIRQGAMDLSNYIQEKAEDIGFLVHEESEERDGIDYGTITPLKLLDPDAKIPIVPVSVSLGTRKEHYLFGKFLYETAKEFSDNIVFIASTELTQDFNNSDPGAYPENSDDDIKIMKAIQNSDLVQLESMPEKYYAKTENKLLPTAILAGFSHHLQSTVSLYAGLIGCGCAFLEFVD